MCNCALAPEVQLLGMLIPTNWCRLVQLCRSAIPQPAGQHLARLASWSGSGFTISAFQHSLTKRSLDISTLHMLVNSALLSLIQHSMLNVPTFLFSIGRSGDPTRNMTQRQPSVSRTHRRPSLKSDTLATQQER